MGNVIVQETRSVFMASIGVDVGQKTDPSALAVAEIRHATGGQQVLFIRHAERLPLGTSFRDVAIRVGAVCSSAYDYLFADWEIADGEAIVNRLDAMSDAYSEDERPTRRPAKPRLFLRVDATGLGAPVVEMISAHLPDRLRRSIELRPCYFTHGDRLTRHGKGRGLTVGKAYLVSRLQALAQAGLLQIAKGVLHADELLEELLDYEIRVDERANDRYGAFKVGSHDDLVTAMGLAVLQTPSMWHQRAVTGGFASLRDLFSGSM